MGPVLDHRSEKSGSRLENTGWNTRIIESAFLAGELNSRSFVRVLGIDEKLFEEFSLHDRLIGRTCTTSALGLSKVMFCVFATEFWMVFVFIRSKYGENLWKNSAMAAVYACVGIFGFLFAVLAGSLGAHMTGKGSVLDPVYALLGVNPVTFGVIGFDFVIVLVSVAFVEIAVPLAVVLYLQRRARLKDSGKA